MLLQLVRRQLHCIKVQSNHLIAYINSSSLRTCFSTKMIRNKNFLYGSNDIKVPMNIHFGDFILKKCVLEGDRYAFINTETGNSITFTQIAQQAIDLAVSLSDMGIRKGQTVAMCTENRLEYYPTLIGAACIGATITLVNTLCTRDEMKHFMAISKPSTIVCSPTTYKLYSKLWKELSHIRTIILYDEKKPGTTYYNDLIGRNISFEDFEVIDVVGQNDTLFILYSSGTTGLPKGVRLSHYNAVITCCVARSIDTPLPDILRTSLAISPWYHSMGLFGSILSMCNGVTRLYMNKFDEKTFFEAIHKYKPGALTIPPPIIVMMTKSQIMKNYNLDSVFLIQTGAAPLDQQTIDEVKSRLPNPVLIIQGYGMTESTLMITKDDPLAPNGPNSKSVGKVTPGNIVKIVDVKTRKPLGPNQRGEICVKSLTIMQGYVGMKKTSDFDEDGFLCTGDIGYYDEEQYVYIVDRLKELIKYKGNQVAPAELEAILLQHNSVQDAGVVGKPDKIAGELPVAFVVVKPGETVTEDEIKEFVKEKVSNPKQLRGGVRFVKEIPKSPAGKILRKELRKQLGKSKL